MNITPISEHELKKMNISNHAIYSGKLPEEIVIARHETAYGYKPAQAFKCEDRGIPLWMVPIEPHYVELKV